MRFRYPSFLSNKAMRTVLILVILICIPFVVIGIYEFCKTAKMDNTFVATEGTVVGNAYRATLQDGAAYFPMVEFQTKAGKTESFTDGIGSYPPDYKVGVKVKIMYDPDNPQDARIKAWKRL